MGSKVKLIIMSAYDSLKQMVNVHIVKITFISVFISVVIYSAATLPFSSLRFTSGYAISALIPLLIAPIPTYTMVKSRSKIENLAAELELQNDVSGTLLADKVRLKQVMYKILSNAVKFTDSSAGHNGRIS